jgi:hypothetical protein
MFTLPEKFMPIPLPQPMKRGRPGKPSDAEPPAKKPRRKTAAASKEKEIKGSQAKRPEHIKRYGVEGDPGNIYIEKRQAIPGSTEEEEDVEITSRKVHNSRA